MHTMNFFQESKVMKQDDDSKVIEVDFKEKESTQNEVEFKENDILRNEINQILAKGI